MALNCYKFIFIKRLFFFKRLLSRWKFPS